MKTKFKKVLATLGLSTLLLGGSMIATAPASAGDGTLVTNVSYSNGPVDFQTKWGNTTNLYPGQSGWNLTYVLVRQGQCVKVGYKGTYCSSRGTMWVSLDYQSWVQRTR